MMKKYFDPQTQLLFISMLLASVIYLLIPGFFPFPMFLFFNVLFAIQLTRRETIRAGNARIAGTILGSIIGLLFYIVVPENILFVPVGVAISVYAGYVFLRTFTPIIAIIVIMLLSGGAMQAPIEYVWSRLSAALVGVAVALVVSYFYRRRSRSSDVAFYDAAEELLAEMQAYVAGLLRKQGTSPSPLHQFIPELQKLRSIRRRLLDDSLTGDDSEDQLLSVITLLADVYMHIQLLQRVGGALNEENVRRAYSRYGIISNQRFSYPIEDDAVVNEHVQAIFDLFAQVETILADYRK